MVVHVYRYLQQIEKQLCNFSNISASSGSYFTVYKTRSTTMWFTVPTIVISCEDYTFLQVSTQADKVTELVTEI